VRACISPAAGCFFVRPAQRWFVIAGVLFGRLDVVPNAGFVIRAGLAAIVLILAVVA
jgi:hypothetical protein